MCTHVYGVQINSYLGTGNRKRFPDDFPKSARANDRWTTSTVTISSYNTYITHVIKYKYARRSPVSHYARVSCGDSYYDLCSLTGAHTTTYNCFEELGRRKSSIFSSFTGRMRWIVHVFGGLIFILFYEITNKYVMPELHTDVHRIL